MDIKLISLGIIIVVKPYQYMHAY